MAAPHPVQAGSGRERAPRALAVVATALALAVPLAGLLLLLRRPHLDVVIEHHPGHFWLVLGAAALSGRRLRHRGRRPAAR